MLENEELKPNLFAKIAAIKGAITRLPEKGYNSFHKYNFVSNDDVYDAIRELLAIHNVALFAEVVSIDPTPQEKGYHVFLQMRFTFACGDTGQTFTCLWGGESADNSDKSFNKAVTAGTKYFLLSTFLISTGESIKADADNSSPNVAKTTNKPTAPKVVDKPETSDGIQYTGEITKLDVREDKHKKAYVAAGGCSFQSREVFRVLGYSDTTIEQMAKKGTTVTLPDAIKIAYVMDGKFRKAVKVQRVSTGEVVEMANLNKKAVS